MVRLNDPLNVAVTDQAHSATLLKIEANQMTECKVTHNDQNDLQSSFSEHRPDSQINSAADFRPFCRKALLVIALER
eukprot:5887694-Amphidinium_carterae.1